MGAPGCSPTGSLWGQSHPKRAVGWLSLLGPADPPPGDGGKKAEACLPLSAALVTELSLATDGGGCTHLKGVSVTGK